LPAVAWLAFLGLLGNFLLPAALSVAVGLLDSGRGAVGSSLCSATAGSELPHKGKSALLVHHCALCTTPAASQLRRHVNFLLAHELGDMAYPPLGTTSLVARFRQGAAQARAPPHIA
jgi:hypothetical protein